MKYYKEHIHILVYCTLGAIMIIYLTGCISTDNIEGIVKETGKGIATVQLATAGKTFADTRKIRAKADKDFDNLVAKLKDRELMMARIKSKEVTAKNSRYIGLIEGTLGTILFITISLFLRFIIRVYKPKKKRETTEF